MPCTAKKTTGLIIEGGNNYMITVKGNQPRLLTQLKTIAEAQKPCEQFVDIEKTRGRTTGSNRAGLHRFAWHRHRLAGIKKLNSSRTHRYPLRKKIFTQFFVIYSYLFFYCD